MPSIKGTASVSDTRALNKALNKTKFPPHFDTSVDTTKVNRLVLSNWIEDNVTNMLGFEDEIVASTVVNTFLPTAPEDSVLPEVDPRKAQVNLEGFLGEADAAKLSAELWKLMIDAAANPSGIPQSLLDAKKEEMKGSKEATTGNHPPTNARERDRQQGRGYDHQREHQRGERQYDNRRSRPVSPVHGDNGDYRRRDNNRHDDRYSGERNFRPEERRHHRDDYHRDRDHHYRNNRGGRRYEDQREDVRRRHYHDEDRRPRDDHHHRRRRSPSSEYDRRRNDDRHRRRRSPSRDRYGRQVRRRSRSRSPSTSSSSSSSSSSSASSRSHDSRHRRRNSRR